MKSKEELVEHLLEHYVDEDGNLDLEGLDFGDFKGCIAINGIRCEGSIYQGAHFTKGDIHQGSHSNNGVIKQSEHKNIGDIEQRKHSNGGRIKQDKHKNDGNIDQGEHKNMWNIYQNRHSNSGVVSQGLHSNSGSVHQGWHKNGGNINQGHHKNGGHIDQEKHSNKGDVTSDYSKLDGKRIDYVELDGIRTYYCTKKELFGFTIYYDVKYKEGTVITNGTHHYHGYSKKDAIRGLRSKIEYFNKDVKPVIDKVKSQGYLSKQDYRDLTGACEAGVAYFCEGYGIESDTLKVDKLVRIFKKNNRHYGADKFLEWFDKKGEQ